jgi:ATP synthase protein I
LRFTGADFIVRVDDMNSTTNGVHGGFADQLKRAVAKALLLQLLMIAVAALILFANGLVMHAFAALLGGAIAVLPNLWFAVRVLLLPAPLHAAQRINSLYKAEAIKLLLGVALFALVFSTFRNVPPATVLGAFVLAHLGYLLSTVLLLRGAGR